MENNYKIFGIRIKPILVGFGMFFICLLFGFIIGRIINDVEVGMICLGFLGLFIGPIFWAGVNEDLDNTNIVCSK